MFCMYLLELSDEDLDGALGLTTRNENGKPVPTLAGLLVIGKERVLREKVSTHEIALIACLNSWSMRAS